MGTEKEQAIPGDARLFATTHWSVVLAAAGRRDSPGAAEALSRLCQAYWYPLYAHVRRRGYSPHDAQDLTQEFFARFLDHNGLARAEQSRGRFRTFLLTSLDHFLINEWEKSRSAKRGGDHSFVSWDEQKAEDRFLSEPADHLTPERAFEKRWAAAMLELVLNRLREESERDGKRGQFEALRGCLWGERSLATYAEMSDLLGMSEAAIKVAVHRLRRRFRELLRQEIAQTVASLEEVEDELRYLIEIVSG